MDEQKIPKDIWQKIKQTDSAEKLLALARERGEELTVEQAEKLFAKFHQSGEVADDELDNVAGGCSEESFPPNGTMIKPAKKRCRVCKGTYPVYFNIKVTTAKYTYWELTCTSCGNMYDSGTGLYDLSTQYNW